jgi:hypothetical protein
LAKLPHRAGLHRIVVRLLECGAMSPALRTMERLEEALGVPPHDLLREPAN